MGRGKKRTLKQIIKIIVPRKRKCKKNIFLSFFVMNLLKLLLSKKESRENVKSSTSCFWSTNNFGFNL